MGLKGVNFIILPKPFCSPTFGHEGDKVYFFKGDWEDLPRLVFIHTYIIHLVKIIMHDWLPLSIFKC